jgi:hypothetical protein
MEIVKNSTNPHPNYEVQDTQSDNKGCKKQEQVGERKQKVVIHIGENSQA